MSFSLPPIPSEAICTSELLPVGMWTLPSVFLVKVEEVPPLRAFCGERGYCLGAAPNDTVGNGLQALAKAGGVKPLLHLPARLLPLHCPGGGGGRQAASEAYVPPLPGEHVLWRSG